MHSKEIITEIKRLFGELFKNDLKGETFQNPEIIDEIDELFNIVDGMQTSWIETKRFIGCNRWNIVMLNNNLKEVYYVYLEKGELKSIGPIKKINIKTHTIQIEGQNPFVLENLCPRHCVGLELGRDEIANHFGVKTDKMKFVAEKLLGMEN